MSQNSFQQNRFAKNANQDRYKMTFDNFDHAYVQRQPQKIYDAAIGSSLKQWARNPLVITVSLFCLGAFAANTVVGFFTSEPVSDNNLPVVIAEAEPFKAEPLQRGGMDVPNRDSTVFQTMRSATLAEQAPVETPSVDDASLQSLQAFAAEAQEKLEDETPPVNLLDPPASEEEAAEMASATEVPASETQQDVAENKAAEQAAAKIENLLAEVDETGSPEEVPAQVAAADGQPVVKVTNEIIPPNPGVVQASGAQAIKSSEASPETLAFVQSVLDKKDTREVLGARSPSQEVVTSQSYETAYADAQAVATIEPASGPATAPVTTGGSYYVQLSSVTSEAGAAGEWTKLQGALADFLTGQPHRVAKADLGERGTYYRIQAGPYAKEAAVNLCEQIKTQKPGGCLVVQ